MDTKSVKSERHLRVLELDKVLAMLSECAGCTDSRERAASLRPSDDEKFIAEALRDTSDAFSLLMRYGSPSVFGLKNVSPQLHRAEVGSALSIPELLDVVRVLRTIRTAAQYRDECEDESTGLDSLFYALSPLPDLEQLIQDSILNEEELADTASSDLRDIRRKIRSTEGKIREQLDKMIRSSSTSKFLQEQLVTMRDGRFVVPVKAEHRSEVKGLVHDTSSSGATYFIEPAAVVEANNEIRILKAKERAEINRILAALSAEAGRYRAVICSGYDALIELDLLFAKARLASKTNAVTPVLSKKGEMRLVKARHPLIDPAKIVPIDMELGGEFDTLIITGPNTGGKTVALKTAGLIALMAACGLMIPAAEGSSVAVYDQILADIGDEQSIEQSLSTFSSHITNIIQILSSATSGSLVLLDELGAGTDPVEGAALAVAIIEQLRGIGCRVMATTHYAEMKVFALQTPGVENASCEFDVASLRPTYRLLVGMPGRSNAFAISRRLGIEQSIVDRASELIGSENTRFEEVVSRLESSRQTMERELEHAQADRVAAQRMKREMDDYKRRMESERDKAIEKAKQEARKIVDQVGAESQRILDELEEIRRAKDSADFSDRVGRAKSQVKAGINRLHDLADPVSARAEEDYVLPRELIAGDSVLIGSIGREGTVLSPPDGGGNVQVQAGIMKLKVPLRDLRLVEKKKTSYTGSVTKSVVGVAERSGSSELDLRGKDTEEALMDLDGFLDRCVLLGIHSVTVIHGKGTGALRTAVQQRLRQNKLVKSFRLGVFGEGESGVTIAELK